MDTADARQRALFWLLEDPDVRKRYKKFLRDAQRQIANEQDEMFRQSRRDAARKWIGRALEALCAGDVAEYAGAVDLAYEIAHHRDVNQ